MPRTGDRRRPPSLRTSFRRPKFVCFMHAGIFLNGMASVTILHSYYHETACWVPLSDKTAVLVIISQCTEIDAASTAPASQQAERNTYCGGGGKQDVVLTPADRTSFFSLLLLLPMTNRLKPCARISISSSHLSQEHSCGTICSSQLDNNRVP